MCKEEDVGIEIVVVIVFERFAAKARPRLLRPLIVLLLQILTSEGVPERLDRSELRLFELFGLRHVAVGINALRENQIVGSSEMLLSVREMFLPAFRRRETSSSREVERNWYESRKRNSLISNCIYFSLFRGIMLMFPYFFFWSGIVYSVYFF